ncbi:MAG: holo-ACP synthase [Burkholderiales bacterium]|nr:holo-ACP synthase [Burkholderiales bacterium]
MITGIGCDIVEPTQIEKAFQRQGENFIDTFLSPLEKPIFIARHTKNKERGIAYLSTRWAAKEALAKALGTGIREAVDLKSISILNNDLGKPYFHFDGSLSVMIKKLKLVAHLSISDTNTAAIAFVICERKE